MIIVAKALDYTKPWTFPDIYLFTGNTTITLANKLVMGRGAAKEVRDAYPGVDTELANLMRKGFPYGLPTLLWYNLHNLQGHCHDPVESNEPHNQQWLGWFMVKDHWQLPAIPNLIGLSARQLDTIARKRPQCTFHLNYPGIGNGRLSEETVQPLIHILPDNVKVYKP